MAISDYLYYYTVGNPVSKAVINPVRNLFTKETKNVVQTPIPSQMPPLWQLSGRNLFFVRAAGLSGSLAVLLGAIGNHKLSVQEKPESKRIFDTANQFHFFHSLALLGVPLSRRPMLAGAMMILGNALFSGILYYRAFTGEKRFSQLAPVGGSCLILAWLLMVL